MAPMQSPVPSHITDGAATTTWRVLLVFLLVVVDGVVAPAVPEMPTARIVVKVRKKRSTYWDLWQINSNICPPSLCRSSGEGSTDPAPRPRGTGTSVFYQGDIVLDKAVDKYIFPEVNHTRYRRAAVRLRDRLWADGEILYQFGDSLSPQARRVVLRAFKHITDRTCITFREKKKADKDFVKFISEPGCWSAIGRQGRRQLLSLGRGCENVGTAIHEITHALGVWHEQARQDRDTYVRILDNNVSDMFMKDFEKVNSQLVNSRGFPYDYTSIMHYSRYAFTRNGKPTIEVIGVGKDLGLTLKQRKALSTIDTAQIRAMYHCNLRADTNQTSCPKGWVKHDTECYRFFSDPQVQFAAASKKCKQLNSHLAWIESKREDQFLARYLLKKFPYDFTWRIGGKRINGTMKWFRDGSNPVTMKYSNWGDNQPSTFTTAVLQRTRSTNVTRWEGAWAGSMAQLPYFMYPFICERRARRSCLKLRRKDGRDYRGELDHTIDGYTCQKWSEQYPHRHNLTTAKSADNDNEDPDGLGDHNYCRNPRKQRRSRPWCYTTKKTRQWQLCDVTACSASASRSSGNRQERGTTPNPPRRRSNNSSSRSSTNRAERSTTPKPSRRRSNSSVRRRSLDASPGRGASPSASSRLTGSAASVVIQTEGQTPAAGGSRPDKAARRRERRERRRRRRGGGARGRGGGARGRGGKTRKGRGSRRRKSRRGGRRVLRDNKNQ